MSHTSKIARLPHEIREQLNRCLLDGHPVKSVLKWLNPLSEVQAVLMEHFDSRPINHVNVSAWRHSGYADWLAQRDALALTASLQDKIVSADPATCANVNERLSRLLAIQYAGSAQTFVGCEPNRLAKWSRLRQLCADVARLRRLDLSTQHLELHRHRLALQTMDNPLKRPASDSRSSPSPPQEERAGERRHLNTMRYD